MEDIVLSQCDYTQLDLPTNPVRIRLNASLVTAKNNDTPDQPGVKLGWVNHLTATEPPIVQLIEANHLILACHNMAIPYILGDEISNEQKEALKNNVKAPLVYSNVVLKHWQPFINKGIHEVYGTYFYTL